MKKSTQKLRLSRETLRQLLLTKAVGGYYTQVPCTRLARSEVGWVISPAGVTRSTTRPEKTDGSARGSWGLGLRKQ